MYSAYTLTHNTEALLTKNVYANVVLTV